MKLEKLDSIRGFASLYVMVHHLFGFTPVGLALGSTLRFPFRFGQEAVILFFLLSGFVIYLSVYKTQDLKFKVYFKKRFRRIYPIIIFSFILSVLINFLNRNPISSYDIKDLFGNLIMLQDINNKPGNWFSPFLGNLPLWSLSYEWIFYIIFVPIYRILPEKNRIYRVLLISIVAWMTYLALPNHISLVLSYLIIWWSGLECAVIFVQEKNFTITNLKHVLTSLFIMLVVSFIPVAKAISNGFSEYDHRANQILFPIVTFRHFLFAFFVVCFGLLWWKFNLILFDKSIGIFRKISPISYGIYILHFPVFASLNIDYLSDSLLLIILIKTLIVMFLSYLLEIKIQPIINSLIA